MRTNGPLAHRAGPLFGAILVVVGALVAVSPAVPGVRALDPTPGPSGIVSPEPGPTPSVEPSAVPTVEPSAVPTVEPSAGPTVGAVSGRRSSRQRCRRSSRQRCRRAAVEPSASPTPEAATGIEVLHSWVDLVDAAGKVDKAGSTDAGLDRMERFTVYRVRFQVANTSTTDLQLSPRLQTGDGAEPVTWQGVPEQDPKEGIAFYAASDAGRAFRARSAAIDPAALRLDTGPAPEYVPTEGVVSAGLNPAPKVNLPARSFTEIVFAVRATVDAKWTRTYAFRLEPGAETVDAGTPVLVTMRSKPPIVLTVPDPKGTATGEALGYQLAVAVVGPDAGPAYPLAPLANPNSPHIASNITSDGCVACHGGHEFDDQSAAVACLPDRPASFTR